MTISFKSDEQEKSFNCPHCDRIIEATKKQGNPLDKILETADNETPEWANKI